MSGKVLYASNGKGGWWRTEFAVQCKESVFILGECQGVKGHDGECWAYSPHGNLLRSGPSGTGSTPPGHDSYISPEVMQEHYYMRHKTQEEVTDPDLIARLEADDPPEKGAGITRPLEEDDPYYEECQRRLEEYLEEHGDD